MEEKRIHLNLKIRPYLKAALEKQAKDEKRSLGNLAEVLLEWSYEQLRVAGNSLELINVPYRTSNLEPLAHSPETLNHVTKEQMINKRVEMGAEIVGNTGPISKKTKNHRSKTS